MSALGPWTRRRDAGHWRGRWAVITGGSSGIGLATAEQLVRAGANVVLLARRSEPLAAAAATLGALRTNDRQRILIEPCDVASRSEVERVFAALSRDPGMLDLLVNSAGIVHPGRFEEVDPATFETTMRINVLGTVHCAQAALPLLTPGRGQIANVSSMAGLLGLFGYTAYSASKFAVVGFSEALRSELAPRGIGVSVLCPPDVETPMLATERALRPPEAAAIAGPTRALSPEVVVDALLAGLARRQFLIVPGLNGKTMTLLKRWAPRLVDRIVDARVRKAARVPRR